MIALIIVMWIIMGIFSLYLIREEFGYVPGFMLFFTIVAAPASLFASIFAFSKVEQIKFFKKKGIK